MKFSCSNIKKFLILQETETPKKFLMFSKKKAFHIFWKTETKKTPLHSGNGTFLYFWKIIFRTLA